MSEQHTPGPWSHAIPGDSFVGSDRGLICKRPAVSGGGDAPKSWDDNARLIAAAPELLDALLSCLEKGSRWHPCDPVVIKARSVIAKAIG